MGKYDMSAGMNHDRSSTRPGMGTSYCYIKCPFCAASTQAYIWSLAGHGRKCTGCGALHSYYGKTYPLAKKAAT